MVLKRLYVLASDEPNLDPRIDWVSWFATDLFQVTVFGMANSSRPEPTSENQHGYEIQRLQKSSEGSTSFAWACCRRFMMSPSFWLCLLAVPFFWPFVVLPWSVLKIMKTTASKICRMMLNRQRREHAFIHVLPRIGRLIWHFAATAVTLYREIRRAPRPDLIYCNDLDTLLGGVLIKALFGCKLIYDAHEFWAHADPASSWWEVKFFLLYEKELLPHVDAAFTVNHLLAQQMQVALGYPFTSLPNCEPVVARTRGVTRLIEKKPSVSKESSELATQPQAIHDIARGRIRFLYQGAFLPERGIAELLRVWSHVETDKAVLLLRGPDSRDKSLCIELAKELGILNKTAYFLDPVFEYDLVAAAAEADVGIIPYKAVTINYRYCCPNKLSQYMQAGLAILANDLDYVRAVINQYQCGLTYIINDENSVLKAINRFIHDDHFLRTCKVRAQKMAVQEYNWENLSQPLYDTCARLVGLAATGQGNEVMVSRVA
jgi:glycosyltransferase involved in cell wall biosynthesis